MPDRFWVGGTANWDGAAGTKWAATSGGAGGQSVPTSADDVFFTNLSTGNCTISTGNTGARSINCTGFTGTLSGTAAISVAGSITLVAGMSYTHSGTTIITGTGTLTSAGKTLGPTSINAITQTVTIGDALTSSGAITLTAGTFTTNNFNVTATRLFSSNSNTRTINLGSSTLTFTSSSFDALDFNTSTNLTFNAGTSQINMSGANGGFRGGNQTFNNVSFTSTTASSARAIANANTFNNLSVTAPAAAGVTQVTFDSRTTINGTLSTTGTAGNRRVWFQGNTYGIAQTLTINSAASLTDADFRDIYVIGTAAPISGTRIGNLRGCRGITFSTPKTVYWNLAGAQNWSADGWAATPTGSPSTNNFPLAQDTATFTNAGSVTGTITLDSALAYVPTVDMSGRTSAMTLGTSNTTTVYGNWINGSGTTLSGVATLTFSGRNTQTITSAGKTFTCPITIDTYGGAVELVDAINVGNGTGTLTVTNGTFDTKNFNVTAGELPSANSNVRAINLGSSTISLLLAPFFGTATNLTLNAGTSQINISEEGGTFNGGGFTFYNLSFTSTAANSTNTINGSNIFNNITIGQPSATGIIGVIFNGNNVINGTLTVAGATAVRRIFVRSSTFGATRTLTVNSLSATDCDFRDITIAGAAAGSSPTRAGNCGGNTGITFPAPKTVYWNLSGNNNWSATAWASGSGGTPAVNNFPLAQDTAVFDNAGLVGTVAVNAVWNIGTFNASARTSAMTLNPAASPVIYGNFLFGTGVTVSSSGNIFFFSGRSGQTITSNGVSFTNNVTIDCATGTVQLADALTLTSVRTLTLTSGTFDAVTYNVTTGNFDASGTGTKTLSMGSGTWTISGTGGSTWSIITTGTTFFKGTANIVLSDTGTTGRTFSGAGFSYNRLTIGGATGTSITTISGNNQFTELASTKTVAHTIALSTTTQTFGAWTVSGTAGNVVTLTGTGTNHILAGACTSGIDYLAMGSIGFATVSPGEFYAGANSTGTAVAPVYRTAKPADDTRYWVNGTGNWSNTARWSASSGGPSGATLPRSHDNVVFDSASNATAYTVTVDAVTGGVRTNALTIAGPASGNVTLAGTASINGIHGNVTLAATGITRTYTGAITLSGSSTGKTFTTNGVALASGITVNGVNCGWTLGSALDMSAQSLTITNGSFDSSTYNVTAAVISSSNANSRTITFGSGTITLSGGTAINFGNTQATSTNLTLNCGTSQISFTGNSPNLIAFNSSTFNNVSFTSTAITTASIFSPSTFNNITFAGRASSGISTLVIDGFDFTVTGTLTLSAGTDATCRTFVRATTIGTPRTLTCAAVSATDIDFRDIIIAGAAAPVSGTRLGDCKGNSGITFDVPKTVYWVSIGSNNWGGSGGASAWALTQSGTATHDAFPLAQDTAVIDNSRLASGASVTINFAYNIGTIDMSARTSNTMTLATGSQTPAIYGNWINGTGTTMTGNVGIIVFCGRTNQTFTSAGVTFTKDFQINSPGGSFTLQDAFDTSNFGFTLVAGTFDANNYNVTATSGGVTSTAVANVRVINIGSGTWALGIAAAWNVDAANLTVTGTGTISLTRSLGGKTFAGGGIQTYPTLDQGSVTTLTITGNNTFANITNTAKATGATTIALGTTTQTVGSFTASGEAGRVLTVQGASASSPATLILTSGTVTTPDYLAITGVRAYDLTDTWYAGANSINNGSLGWYFEASGFIAAFIIEAATADSSESSIATLNIGVSETITAADAQAAGLLYLGTLSESATIADAVEAFRAYLALVAEFAAAQDSDAVAASTFNASSAETAIPLDATQGAKTAFSSLSESATISDANSAAAIFEGRATAFVQNTAPIQVGTSGLGSLMFDSASFVDNCAVVANGSGTGDSGGFASDGNYIQFSYDGSFPTNAQIVTVPLSFTNTGQIRVTYITGNGTNGGAAFTGLVRVSLLNNIGTVISSSFLSETATYRVGILSVPAGVRNTAVRLEIVATVTAAGKPSVGIKEIALWGVGDLLQAEDSLDPRSLFTSQVAEVTTSADSTSVAPSTFGAIALAAAQAAESFSPAGSVYNAALPVESAGITDFLVGGYLWNPIDDNQTPNWQNIANSQGSGWTQINTDDAPNWQPTIQP